MDTLTKEQIEEARRSIINDFGGIICGLTDAETFGDNVAEYILAQTGMINLDYHDTISVLRGKTEADAIVVEFDKDEMREQLDEAFKKLKEAHPNKLLASIMLQIVIPETPELCMEDMAIFHDFFESIQGDGLETKWGISNRTDDSHRYKIFIIVGFK